MMSDNTSNTHKGEEANNASEDLTNQEAQPKADSTNAKEVNPSAEAKSENSTSTESAEAKPKMENAPQRATATEAVKNEASSEGKETDTGIAQADKPLDTGEPTTDATDEELDSADDTAEVEGEDEDEEHPEELELPDYAEFESKALIEAASKLLESQPAHKLKDHFEAIRSTLIGRLNEEKAQKLAAFKEEGGNEIDFEYEQPLRQDLKKVYGKYRHERKKYYQELSDKLEANLKAKQDLIEKLKQLITTEESIGKTFKEFNEIQNAWRETGPVPRAESHNLWQTWHHHVHNFYEFIDLNKELRDLDYKKNREEKEGLIGKAEELLEAKDLPHAFKTLQNLHKKWKNAGPVAPEMREPLWEKFTELSKTLRTKQDEYYEQLREKRAALIVEKEKLVAQIKEVPTNLDKHGDWQKAMTKIKEYAEAFKKIGRQRHPDNDAVWEAYREALGNFNKHKNEFYKGLKKEQNENLEKKKALVAKAEELKESENWRDTANELKQIQAKWKTIGHVPRKYSDKIWKEFRAACNHFFNRLTAHNKGKDEAFEGNLAKKEEVLKNLSNLELNTDEPKKAVNQLKEFISQWRSIGQVPRGKGKVEKTFNELLDKHFDAINLSKEETSRLRFENKMKSMSDQGGTKKLAYERKILKQNIDEAQKELGQLETNMSFFSSSNPKSPIVKEAQKKIERQQGQITKLQAQLKMLNIEIRQQEAAAAKAEEKPSDNSDETQTE